MFSDSIVILGIPVDNLELNETMSQLFGLAEDYDIDGRPRLVVPVKADTLIYLRSLSDNQNHFSAFMNTLRQADLLVPIGTPVSWAARILGTPLRKRISGTWFFQQILDRADESGKSIYFIGGTESEMQAASHIIASTRSGLTIAGNELIGIEKIFDDSTAEHVNSSGADFLFIDINDPVLVEWFEKYRHRLYVPVTVVLSGTRNLIRAAAGKKGLGRFKDVGLKSDFLFTRIWKIFFPNYFKFARIVVPFVFYQKYQQMVFKMSHHPSMIPAINSAVSRSGSGMVIKTITMPDPLDASITDHIRDKIKRMIRQAPKIILDFSKVNFIDSSGLGLLLGLWRTAQSENRELFIIGVKPTVNRFFNVSRTYDFFEDRMCKDTDEVLDRIKKRARYSSFYYLAVIRNRAVVYHLFGALDASEVIDLDIESFMEPLGGRDVIFNLAGLHFIDSTGIRLFVKMHRQVSQGGGSSIVCGIQDHVHEIFSILGLDQLFRVAENIHAAELALRRIHIQRAMRSKSDPPEFSPPVPNIDGPASNSAGS